MLLIFLSLLSDLKPRVLDLFGVLSYAVLAQDDSCK